MPAIFVQRVLQCSLCLALLWLPVAAQEKELLRLYQEAQKAQAAGELATATAKYEAIVRIRPDMAEAFANLGNLYFQQGKKYLAAPAYKRAIQLKPSLTGPYFFLGQIAFHEHAYKEALGYLKRAETLEPQNPLVRSYLGYTYYAQASYDDSARQLEAAVSLDPTDQEALYHLGKSYGHLAQDSFAELKKRYPNSFFTNLARAHYYETVQDWQGSAEQYAAALAKKPDQPKLKEKAEWTAAKAAGRSTPERAASTDELVDGSLIYLYSAPTGDSVHVQFQDRQRQVLGLAAKGEATAEASYYKGEAYQALSYLASILVVALDPKSPRARLLQAQFFESSGKEEDAIGAYNEVLRDQPELPNVHFAIGNLHWKSQRFVEAKAELLKEIAMNPNHPQALYELGDIDSMAGNDKQAEQRYTKALKYEPNMVEAHFALEKIYTSRGDYGLSLEHLRAVQRIDPSDPAPHYRLAQIYRKRNQVEAAQRELRLFEEQKSKTKE